MSECWTEVSSRRNFAQWVLTYLRLSMPSIMGLSAP